MTDENKRTQAVKKRARQPARGWGRRLLFWFLGLVLVAGVANDIPVIEGYSERSIDLEAGVNLFEFLRLLASLGQTPADLINYKVTAKVDFRGLLPTQRVEKSGVINLR